MNIVKLQNQLKSVPVETLIKYVQGMNPEVPSYLALAEIKNRKEMEQRYAAQSQKAPEKSVAEDLTQAPTSGLEMLAKNPQLSPGAPSSQGVADLPVPDDMYQDQSFAAVLWRLLMAVLHLKDTKHGKKIVTYLQVHYMQGLKTY